LQVHHRTYERLGHEQAGDLTALCANCHRAVTDMLRRRRYSGRLPLFHDTTIANCMVPLFDPTVRGSWL
jgi:5-methylcytosine-specific restriction endonuclease McrA